MHIDLFKVAISDVTVFETDVTEVLLLVSSKQNPFHS